MPAVIAEVEQGSPAYEAGLQKGDRITEIAGKKVADYRDIFLYQTVNPGKPYEMEWSGEKAEPEPHTVAWLLRSIQKKLAVICGTLFSRIYANEKYWGNPAICRL